MTTLAHFASRGIAVVIIAIVLAFICMRFERQERAHLQTLQTRDEVVDHVQSYRVGSYVAALALLTGIGLGFVAVVEAIAYGIRAVWPSEKRATVAAPASPPPPAAPPKVERKPEPPRPQPPARSEAITLLAALQREARFIDFIKEPIDGYPDASVGAAVRDIHRECGKVLDRMFAPRPVVAESEGATIEVPATFDAARYRLTGNVRSEGPFHGQLVHHGWEASACNLPTWSGDNSSALVLAPAEVEVK